MELGCKEATYEWTSTTEDQQGEVARVDTRTG
jgi:hypothetical protein